MPLKLTTSDMYFVHLIQKKVQSLFLVLTSGIIPVIQHLINNECVGELFPPFQCVLFKAVNHNRWSIRIAQKLQVQRAFFHRMSFYQFCSVLMQVLSQNLSWKMCLDWYIYIHKYTFTDQCQMNHWYSNLIFTLKSSIRTYNKVSTH